MKEEVYLSKVAWPHPGAGGEEVEVDTVAVLEVEGEAEGDMEEEGDMLGEAGVVEDSAEEEEGEAGTDYPTSLAVLIRAS